MPFPAPPEPGSAWSTPPAVLALTTDTVHVWRAELDRVGQDDVTRLACALAPDERARAAAFVFTPDRRRFTVARAALRCILARYLGLTADAVGLHRLPAGRPALIGEHAGALAFSVSRSAGLALCAVALHRDIGVDIERVVRGVVDDVVRDRILSPAEVGALRPLAPEARERAFFAAWTRKEAYAKARGLGLALAFERFTVSTSPDAPALLIADDDDPGRWTLRDLDAGPGYAAALAVTGGPAGVSTWEWAPDLSVR
jgi:4'-phosphopantetheinyl transferase